MKTLLPAALLVFLSAQGAPWVKPATNDIPPLASADLSQDPLRPQLRFTQRLGWANDPNGLVWWKGGWHFFHQHNPYGVKWGNMHWNHAVSPDLVHWTELGDALEPDALGTMFSGSAVTDFANTAGFGAGAQVLVYTAAGTPFTQCIAASTDGRAYAKFAGNPVLANLCGGNRDPRVLWHAPTKRWVMALYGEENGRHVVWFFTSPDLKSWTKTSTYVGGEKAKKDSWLFECPGLEELPIEGEDRTAWVVWGAGDAYAVGSFDGRVFTPVEERIPGYAHAPGKLPYYAAQTFGDVPDGRKVWIAWMRAPYLAGASYSQSFSLPQELTLRRTSAGLRLVRRPARELARLRDGEALSAEDFGASRVELAEIDCSCRLEPNGRIEAALAGVPIMYDAAVRTLKVAGTKVPWTLTDGRLALKIFLDRVGIEVFSEDGLQMAPFPEARPVRGAPRLTIETCEGVSDELFAAVPLRSVWARNPWVGELPALFASGAAVPALETTGPRAQLVPGDWTRFERVFARLQRGEGIRIAVIGGSITQGARASSREKQWGSQFAAGWRRAFPSCKIDFVNAGIGATGSEIGAFRLGRDVLAKQPDVVAVEFSVNDASTPACAAAYEGVVRQLLKDPRGIAVILLGMVSQSGGNVQEWHGKVARHYQVPYVSYRDALYYPYVKENQVTWRDISPDSIHPNDVGHAYAAALLNWTISRRFRAFQASGRAPAAVPALPAPLFGTGFDQGRLCHVQETKIVSNAGFFPLRDEIWGEGLACTNAHGRLVFEVEGPTVALLYRHGCKPYKWGKMRVRLDGATVVDGLDCFSDQWWWHTPALFLCKDRPGRHVVEVETLDAEPARHAGCGCHLTGVLVAEGR